MKKILIILLCFALLFGVTGCKKTDPREREIVQLVVNNKFDEAISRVKEVYEGKEMEDMLSWINGHKNQKSTSNATLTKLEIQSDYIYSVSEGYGYIKGKVKNVSNADISYFEVVIDLKDEQGNTLHSEYTNDGLALKPNAMREFEIMFKHSDEYKKYSLSIGKVR